MSEVEQEYDSQGLPDFVRDPLGVLRRRWMWMLPTLVLGLIGTTAFVASMQPSFRASASLLVASQRIPEEFVRTTVPEDLLQRVDALVAQTLTRDRMVQLVEKHELYPDLRESLTMAEVATIARTAVTVELDPSVRVGRRQDTAMVFIVSFAAESGAKAAAVANEIVGLIQAEAIRVRTEQASLATDFLMRELKRTESELREIEGELTSFKRSHRGELPSELDANIARLERLQQERQSLALQITEASTRITMLSSQPSEAPATPDERLASIRAQLAREKATKTDAHPDIVALRSELAQLEREIQDQPAGSAPVGNRRAMVAAEENTLRELRRQLAQTEASIVDLDARVARTPLRQEKLEALEQKATVLRDEYLEFLRKVQDAELAESLERAQQGERVTILNRATPPAEPERSRAKFLVAGLVASLGLAAAMGVALELVDPVLVHSRQIEADLGLPVLGSVARIR